MRPREVDGCPRAITGVPGVFVAVVVVVPEVVGLPGERRHDDGDAMLAEPPWSEDERREGDAPAGCLDAGEVDAGSPVADANRQRPAAPVLERRRDGDSLHLVVSSRPLALRARAEDLHGKARRAVPDSESRLVAGAVALAAESRLERSPGRPRGSCRSRR